MNGTQRATEEELWVFWRVNSVYDLPRLKSLGCFVTDGAMQDKKMQSCKYRIIIKSINSRVEMLPVRTGSVEPVVMVTGGSENQ